MMKDKPLELDKIDILLCISGIRIVRDCGLLDEAHDKHAKGLLDRLGQFVEEDDEDE